MTLDDQPRGVAPTQAGRVFYQAALAGIASLDAALRQLGELRTVSPADLSAIDYIAYPHHQSVPGSAC
jgi:DNA-binding transcriptional LysR family regulator